MKETIQLTKKFFFVSQKEVIYIIAHSIVFGFLFSFQMWGTVSVDYFYGLSRLLLYSVFSFFALLLIIFGQKFFAARNAIEHEVGISIVAICLSLFLAMISNGSIVLPIPPGFHLGNATSFRVGMSKYQKGIREYARIGFGSIMVATLVALIFRGLGFVYAVEFAKVVIFLLFMSMIPIDFLIGLIDKKIGVSNGTVMLYHSRTLFIFAAVFFASSAFMVVLEGFLYSVFFGLTIAGIIAIYYYAKYET